MTHLNHLKPVFVAALLLGACNQGDAPSVEEPSLTAEEDEVQVEESTAEAEPVAEAPRAVTASATRISLRFAADSRVDATHFDVSVTDGVAELTGTAASATEFAVAEAIAMADPDVTTVTMPGAAPALVEGETVPTQIDVPDPREVFSDAIAVGTPHEHPVPGTLTGQDEPSEEEAADVLAAAASGDRPRTYRVQSGDSLSVIARRTMNDGDLWFELYEYNRNIIGPDPERLQVGMELRIPQD